MPRTYVHTTVRAVPAWPDGTLIFTSGRFVRGLDGALLRDRDHGLPLVGEPFDWLPTQGAAVDLWGELWLGPRPRLLVHNARPLGQTSRRPVLVHPRPTGVLGTLTARVVSCSGVCIATTAQHHHYVLSRPVTPDGLYRLTGQVSGLVPPTFEVLTCTPLMGLTPGPSPT